MSNQRTSPPAKFDPETHSYFDRTGQPVMSVTQILAKAGICDFSCVPRRARELGMKRGTSVHWMLQLEDEKALDYRTVPDSLKPYRKAYKTWKKHSGFNPLLIEHPFLFQDYAGTIDRGGSFPATTMYTSGTSAIVDLKTGLQNWVRYQLAAYAVGITGDVRQARFTRRIALLLKKDGTYSVREFPLNTFDTDWAEFCRAKEEALANR